MTPDDKSTLIANFSGAIANISAECIEAGIPADVMAEAIGKSLCRVAGKAGTMTQAAAALRLEARKLDAMAPRVKGSASDAELVQMTKQAHDLIDTMQVAGIPENEAVTALNNACIERVARFSGAAGAAHWLRRMANLADSNGDALETIARHG